MNIAHLSDKPNLIIFHLPRFPSVLRCFVYPFQFRGKSTQEFWPNQANLDVKCWPNSSLKFVGLETEDFGKFCYLSLIFGHFFRVLLALSEIAGASNKGNKRFLEIFNFRNPEGQKFSLAIFEWLRRSENRALSKFQSKQRGGFWSIATKRALSGMENNKPPKKKNLIPFNLFLFLFWQETGSFTTSNWPIRAESLTRAALPVLPIELFLGNVLPRYFSRPYEYLLSSGKNPE